jgi:hypothetical protein
MGLDISVISKIKPISIPEDIELWSNEYYEWEKKQDIQGTVWNFQPNQHFPEQSEGLPDGFGYGTGEEYSFRAGSYSGYGEWRDLLSRLALDMGSEGVWNKIDSGVGYSEIPFSEVINFSDADGIIGPVASKKLHNDFVNYEKDIMKKLDRYYLKFEDFEIDGETYDWFKNKYKDWKEAFRIASNNGAVIFH